LPLILLALLPEWSEKYGTYVKRMAGITGFVSADLTVHRPNWAKDAWYEQQPYWGLGDRYPQLFDQLASSGRYGVIPDASVPSTYDEFRISIGNSGDLDALLRLFETDRNMFAAFERLQAEGLLTTVIQLTKADGARLTTDDLSSGEQQMLTILGMLRLQRGKESLFLLDEPASHFHPAWSQRWYSSVREMLEDGQRSQFIASTHDPALVSNVPQERIRLFHSEGARIIAETPDVDPQGMGVGALLTTELWGLETQLDASTQQLIDEQHELAGYPQLSDVERERLRQVNEELDNRDFATERRDPVVALFLSELARRRQELIEAAGSGAPIPADEIEALVRQLFADRFLQGL
jgi:energy-coupling factor transporter ATP-binding protein EcfA2